MITLICGKTATGKSSVVKVLSEVYHLKPIVTYTTRPPRPGEKNRIDYNFISDEEFYRKNKDGFFAETTSYKVADGSTWYYGTALSDLTEDSIEDKVLIVNPSGLKEIKKYNIHTKSVLITASEDIIWRRLVERGDSPNEAVRRINADKEDFKGIYDNVDFIISSDDLSPAQIAENINIFRR